MRWADYDYAAREGWDASHPAEALRSLAEPYIRTRSRAAAEREKMSNPVPTGKGWHPDPDTGGTRYWDGLRWTGDRRPPRKPFAAASSQSHLAGAVAMGGASWSLLLWMGSMYVAAILFGLATVAIGIYLLRGQGPSTQDVEARLAEEDKVAKSRRRTANVATFAAGVGQFFKRPQTTPASSPNPDTTSAAQINAISNPETARALQNLQNLLYTRAITDQEFQAAKDRLLGAPAAPSDSFTQIAQLAELHRAGILGDVEFAAAKAKALGI